MFSCTSVRSHLDRWRVVLVAGLRTNNNWKLNNWKSSYILEKLFKDIETIIEYLSFRWLCQRFLGLHFRQTKTKCTKKSIYCAIFDEKGLKFFVRTLLKFFARGTPIQQISNALLSLVTKNTLSIKKLNILYIISAKLWQILAKITENVNKNCRIFTKF